MLKNYSVFHSALLNPPPGNRQHAFRNINAGYKCALPRRSDSQISGAAAYIKDGHARPDKMSDYTFLDLARLPSGKKINAPIVTLRPAFKNLHEYIGKHYNSAPKGSGRD